MQRITTKQQTDGPIEDEDEGDELAVDQLERQLQEENPLLLRWIREADRADKMMDAVESRVDSLMNRLEFMLNSVGGGMESDDNEDRNNESGLPSSADLLYNDPDDAYEPRKSNSEFDENLISPENVVLADESETRLSPAMVAEMEHMRPAIDQLTAELMEMLSSQELIEIDGDDEEIGDDCISEDGMLG